MEAELEPGIVLFGAAVLGHLRGPGANAVGVGADQGRRDEPEGGEGRVATPDGRLAVEDGTEAAFLGERLQLGTGVGDDGELLWIPAGQLPEVLQVRAGLQRRPRLGGRDEEAAVDVDRLLQAADRLRMRGVEDVEVGGLEGAAEDLRGEARPAHAQQDVVLVLAGGKCGQVELAEGLVQPPEPLRLVLSRPDGGVTRPDPLDELLPLAHAETSSPRLALIPSISSENESENFSTPSFSSTAVTSS